MRHYDDPMLISLDEVMRLGRERMAKEIRIFSKDLVSKGTGDDISLLFYTSGTTSLPKGALLTHYNMLKMGQNLMRVDPCSPDDDFVSYLPFAWIGEQMMSISCGLQMGYTINFPEEPETSQEQRERNWAACDVCAPSAIRAVYQDSSGQTPGCDLVKTKSLYPCDEDRLSHGGIEI